MTGDTRTPRLEEDSDERSDDVSEPKHLAGSVRSAFPSLRPAFTARWFVLNHLGSPHVVDSVTGKSGRLRVDRLNAMLKLDPAKEDGPTGVVLVDKAAEDAVFSLLERSGSELAPQTKRMVEFEQALPLQFLLPTLTTALARRFWGEDWNVDEWGSVLRVTGKGLARAQKFVKLCSETRVPFDASLVETMTRNAVNGIVSASYQGLESESRAFRHATRFSEAWAAYEGADPLLAERNFGQGLAVSVEVHSTHSNAMRTSVGHGFRLREQEVAYVCVEEQGHLLSQGLPVRATLGGTEYVNGKLEARFEFKGATPPEVISAHNSGYRFYLVQAPFPVGHGAVRPGRANRAAPLRRPVPFVLALAARAKTKTSASPYESGWLDARVDEVLDRDAPIPALTGAEATTHWTRAVS